MKRQVEWGRSLEVRVCAVCRLCKSQCNSTLKKRIGGDAGNRGRMRGGSPSYHSIAHPSGYPCHITATRQRIASYHSIDVHFPQLLCGGLVSKAQQRQKCKCCHCMWEESRVLVSGEWGQGSAQKRTRLGLSLTPSPPRHCHWV